jgi:hypothetical protein
MQAVLMDWKRLLGWDGVLPAVVALVPWTVTFWLPRNSVSALGVIVLAPVVAALVRASVGYEQFRSIGLPWPPMWRQLMLGVGISLLFLGEAVVGILTLIDDEPIETWLLPAVIYVCYFACIVVAFRNTSPQVPKPCSLGMS